MYAGKNISELLLELYDFPASGEFDTHALSVLDRYVPSGTSNIYQIDFEKRQMAQTELRSWIGDDISETLEELSSLLPTHPFAQYFLTGQGGAVLCTDDILSEAEWKKTALYNELYVKYDLAHDLSVRFNVRCQCTCLNFVTATPSGPETRRMLNLVAPHLGNAFSAFQVQKKGLVEKLPSNIVLLSPAGVLVESSAEAAALLDRYYPFEKRRAGLCLPETVERWARHEICAANDERNKAPEKLTARMEEQQLCLSLIRHGNGWLLLMEEFPVRDPVDVLTGLGLTHREAEVLVWMLQGKQNSDIAMILDICTATVRKHVEHILHKLHCETRGAAALFAMQTLAKSGSDLLLSEASL